MNLLYHSTLNLGKVKREKKLAANFLVFRKIIKTRFGTINHFERCLKKIETYSLFHLQQILNPLSANFTKWSNPQTIRRQIADDLFECV